MNGDRTPGRYEGAIEPGQVFVNAKGRRVRFDSWAPGRFGWQALLLVPLTKGGRTSIKEEEYFRWEFRPETASGEDGAS